MLLLLILILVGGVSGYILEKLAVFSLREREYKHPRSAVWVSILIMGLLLPLLYLINSEYFILHVVVAVLLVWILLTDWMAMLILNKTLLLFLFPIVILRLIFPLPGGLIDSVIGAVGGFSIMLILAILSKGQVGGGDIKLYGLLGFVFGWNGILINLFLATVIALVGTLLLIVMHRRSRQDAIPFGPYIAAASCLLLIVPIS